jgi:hypothetical protein
MANYSATTGRTPCTTQRNTTRRHHYPSPNALVFTPSWQQQQPPPISPLPKQLSMPVPITPQEPQYPLHTSSLDPPPTSVPHNGPSGLADRKTPHSHPASSSPQKPVLLPIASHKPRISRHHPHPPHLHILRLFFQQNRPFYLLLRSSIPLSPDTPTQAGSPPSLHTSLSVASTKDGKDVGLSKEVDSMSAEEEAASDIPVSAQKAVAVPTTTTSITSTPSIPAVPPPQATPPPTATPLAAPPPAPPKKFWASLLRPSTSSSSASAYAGPSRNALPTSSVVGISIPAASAAVQDAALHVSPSRKSEFVRLLTSGPGVAHNHCDFLCWIRSVHYDHDHESNTVNKNPPPGVDQLWQHVFCQFGVAN